MGESCHRRHGKIGPNLRERLLIAHKRYRASGVVSGLADRMFLDQMTSMNLDDQIHRYFGTSDLAAVSPEAIEAAIEHIQVDLGLTKDRGERFALWALLHTLGSAPDLDVVFKTDAEREAARNFMDLVKRISGA